ncbi:hypothetical protein OHD16_15590 [Sphingobacterium sp. ML3W]|uniref:hypothetical protein n=1 Tax=Sphingobacterium sp. ML3W TaxID=1538644 RepID=UPI00249A8D47|nr:hypothetical protein [Sphingobacterium sp. ML3W]WFA81377.1 hypothetical protein OGI71_08730 [Sphingobacterium sp. ML3W]
MSTFFAKLLELDLAFFKIYEKEYDPKIDIQEFWDKYDIKNCRDHIFDLFINQLDRSDIENSFQDINKTQEFLISLLCVFRGYFAAHSRNVDLRGLDAGNKPKSSVGELQLKANGEVYELFEQVSTTIKNKL